VSVVSGDPPFRCVMTSSAADAEVAGITDTCLPPGVTSSADDDERSLDENLRPMDGQIWLPDVDGGLPDTFQTTVNTALINVAWPSASLRYRDNFTVVQKILKIYVYILLGWFRGSAVERWSLTGELSLSCARPTADG